MQLMTRVSKRTKEVENFSNNLGPREGKTPQGQEEYREGYPSDDDKSDKENEHFSTISGQKEAS